MAAKDQWNEANDKLDAAIDKAVALMPDEPKTKTLQEVASDLLESTRLWGTKIVGEFPRPTMAFLDAAGWLALLLAVLLFPVSAAILVSLPFVVGVNIALVLLAGLCWAYRKWAA